MARLIAFLIGIGFVAVLGWSLFSGALAFVSDPPEETVEHRFHEHARDIAFQSDGPFGSFDRQQLQRGFQVYKDVCAACHSLNLVAFRNLEEIGFTEPEVDAIAEQWLIQTPSIDPETGENVGRAPTAADRFPNVYANEVAARAANNNALPPDLSLITKARHGGADYIYSLLVGYQNPPADLPAENQPGPGTYFNPYFANLNIAMPSPLLADGQVAYAPGNPPATIDQMAQDVSAFLVWTAEPSLERRHAAGWAVLAFLIFATGLAWLAKRNVWRELH